MPLPLTLTRPLIGLDLETTSNKPEYARIVSLALEIYEPDGTVRPIYELCNPGVAIPPASTAVHHITDAMVADAMSEHDLLTGLHSTFMFAPVDYAGYNIRFDLEVLAARYRAYSLPFDYSTAAAIDSYRLWQVLEGRSLIDAVKHFLHEDVPDAAPHNAQWDIRQTMRVLEAQLRIGSLPDTPAALHELCSPGFIDPKGQFRWNDNHEVEIGFGKHRGSLLRDVPAGYLHFMLRGEFSDLVKNICSDALRGVYPVREVSDGRTDHRPAED